MIQFLNLSLRNFRSYESLDMPLDGQGVVLIVGPNGTGKSNIWTGLSWVLYGKTVQGVPAEDLIRWGASSCWGAVSFVSHAGETIKVLRKRTSTRETVRIIQGGKREEYGSRGGNRRIQEHLGWNWRAFTNTVFVGSGVNKYFLMLLDGDKKKLLEDLMELDRFRLGYAEVSNRVRHLTLREEAVATTVQANKHSLQRVNTEIEETRRKGLRLIQARLAEIEEEQRTLDAQVRSRQAECEGDRGLLRQLNAYLAQQEKIWGTLHHELAFEKKRIHALSKLEGKDCSECEKPLSREESLSIIGRHEARIEQIDEAVPSLSEVIGEVRKQIEEIRRRATRLLKVEEDQAALLERQEVSVADRDRLQADYGKMLLEQRQYFEGRLHKVQKTLGDIQRIKPYFRYWMDGFGSKGIKADFLGRILPVLESYTNDYLSFLSDDFFLEFDLDDGGTFRTKITSAGNSAAYTAWSAGERRRLDMATSLALCSLVEETTGISSNLQLLDEVVEGFDSEGSAQFADMVGNLRGDKSVFVLSHNEPLIGCFDAVWKAQKAQGISTIHQ